MTVRYHLLPVLLRRDCIADVLKDRRALVEEITELVQCPIGFQSLRDRHRNGQLGISKVVDEKRGVSRGLVRGIIDCKLHQRQ